MSEIHTSSMNLDKARTEGAIVQCIKDWAVAYPHELVAIDQKVKDIRSNLARSPTSERSRGLTRDKKMLHKAEVPTTLYCLMQQRIDKDWTRDRSILSIFLRNFRVGLINRTSEIKV